ncbi:MAG: hypothetical protein ABI895_09705 [Deltaproteobacteria bacterium]
MTYASGSFSFINYDCGVENDELRQFLTHHLNANGLFASLADTQEFLRLHQKANDVDANLETLGGAIAVQLWEDSDGSRLRRALGL